MEVHLTTSELAALKRMAGHEGYVQTKWVVAMVRTKLTGQPQIGQPELETLACSNQQLLVLGRNLSQIAKVERGDRSERLERGDRSERSDHSGRGRD